MNTHVADRRDPTPAPQPSLAEARSAADVELLADFLYGPGPAHWGTGVLHPTSVWRGPAGDFEQPMTLRIGDRTPKSEWDLFALCLARARADAIITSGRILRAEPGLRHELLGPGTLPEALAQWRRELGKSKPPLSLVLSLSGEIDFEHPLFSGAGRVVVYTGERGAWRLESRAADAGVEVQAAEPPTVRGAIEFARAAFGCATISVEAGPSTTRGLYRKPAIVDEALFSTYLGTDLPTAARGGRQITRATLEQDFYLSSPATVVRQGPSQDGDWRFERFLKAR